MQGAEKSKGGSYWDSSAAGNRNQLELAQEKGEDRLEENRSITWTQEQESLQVRT